MSWPSVALGEFIASKVPSLNPAKSPDELFELLSIPAYDEGQPEVLRGDAIGSSKKLVRSGDVLLSRIVPHIRRSWVVTPTTRHKTIASGEWIIFRTDQLDQGYLRHFLLSDVFHPQLMRTVAGVGGSLLRARPDGIAQIEIPLPPLEEQKRIAAILDQADELRRLRRRVIDRLDTLAQSVFYEMFGDPLGRDGGYPVLALNELLQENRPLTYGILKPGPDVTDGVRYIRVVDIQQGRIVQSGLRRTTKEIAHQYRRSTLAEGDLLISIRGHVGRLAIVDGSLEGANITQDTARLAFRDPTPEYFECLLSMPQSQHWFSLFTKGMAVRGINLGDLRRMEVIVPPLEKRIEFCEFDRSIRAQRDRMMNQQDRSNLLFASLQQRAFRGEL